MSDYKVPKRQVVAEARLLGAMTRQWEIFLSDVAEARAGPERATDLFNRKHRFLPVKDKELGHLVVNTQSVLFATVPADAEFASDALSPEDLAASMSVTTVVELVLEDGQSLRGTLVYLQPEGRQRLQDYLNEAPTFIAIRDGDRGHIVNTARVVQVRTLSSGDGGADTPAAS